MLYNQIQCNTRHDKTKQSKIIQDNWKIYVFIWDFFWHIKEFDRKEMVSKISFDCKDFLLFAGHYTRFLVLSDSSFKEIGLSLQRDHLHPVERILRFVMFWDTQWDQESVGHKLNILRHRLNKFIITLLLIPTKSDGNDSVMNLFSIWTASVMIS